MKKAFTRRFSCCCRQLQSKSGATRAKGYHAGLDGRRDYDITEIDITESDVAEFDITENDITESDITETNIT